ncbi:MAG TPA: hypothetical protein VHH88_09985 [Verrucomicrobiae bacterium]|nr:hypothetical protein [Verrucomicrobiae bacterium]
MEKRMVAGIGIAVFILINLWFVVPHFSDWGDVQARNAKAQRTLQVFQNEINQRPTYERMLASFEGEGQNVPAEDQSIHFSGLIQSEALRAGVAILSTARQTTTTNQFFLELSQTIRVQSREQPLVDFLYNLGSSNSMIRVRDLTINPDQARQQLIANIKLVASYQKKTASRSTTSATKEKPKTTPAPSKSGGASVPASRTHNQPPATKQPKTPPGYIPRGKSIVPPTRAPATNKPGIFNTKRS